MLKRALLSMSRASPSTAQWVLIGVAAGTRAWGSSPMLCRVLIAAGTTAGQTQGLCQRSGPMANSVTSTCADGGFEIHTQIALVATSSHHCNSCRIHKTAEHKLVTNWTL